MTYSLTATGAKADTLANFRQQIAEQMSTNPNESKSLEAVGKEVDEIVAAHSLGDGDTVGISVNGSTSNSPESFSVARYIGVTISKGSRADVTNPHATAASVAAASAPAASAPSPTLPTPVAGAKPGV